MRLAGTFANLCVSFFFLAIAFLGSQVEAQQAKYWIDHELDACRQNDEQGTHTVMAYAPSQYSWCAWRFSSLEEARETALRGCRSGVPSKLRKLAPCRIIWEDGKVVDQSAFREERRDHRVPMVFEIYDGVTGSKDIKKGFVVTGKFKDRNSIPLKIQLQPGGVVCEGAYSTKSLRVDARIKCFDEFIFVGKKIRRGGHFQDGKRFVAFFEATFQYEDSYIKATLLR